MKLNEKWNEIVQSEMEPTQSKKFWEAYFLKEKEIYEEILKNKTFKINTTVNEFSEKYKIEPVYAIGFLDGINTSLKKAIKLEKLEEESPIKMDIDVEKLFYNMHEAQAEWLYTMPEWDDVLSLEKRVEIEKEYKASKTVVVSDKIGRNDPCNCGSGKKYKKCCG